ncbi:MAG: HD family phosphohydrolase [Bacillota bacterium]|nr:HD family phosphohydrolase [Bacillota bacterium]MDW7677054.1 HD family phosphohydrolase [Bacillota bacterium]
MIIEKNQQKRYQKAVCDILENELFQSTRQFIHHKDITCLDHAVYVSYTSFCLAEKHRVDPVSTARGALLHDFYLYDWHHRRPDDSRLLQLHGFRHPAVALRNAQVHFEINAVEADIIKKHMWPLTLFRLPKTKASILVSLVDKYCTTKEVTHAKTRRDIKELVAALYAEK